MRHTLVIPLSFTGMLMTGVLLYAEFQAQRLESADVPPQAVSAAPRSAALPPSQSKKQAGRSGETADSSSREIHCPDSDDDGSKPSLDPGPGKLGPDELIDGIDGIKTEIEKCGAGAKVTIKFVIDGSTGAVTSATALDEHASTPLGTCVARAAKHAKFPKFEAPQQGFTFKFRL